MAPADQPVHFLDRVHRPANGAVAVRHCPQSPPRRSVPARAWRRSGPPDPGSSECRAVARLRPASVWTPAAPGRAGTSSKPVPRAGPPATPPGPTLRRPQRSSRPYPAHPHLLGPAHRHDAECPLGKSCRRAGRSGRQAPPSPCGIAFSEGSGSLSVLPGSSPITFTSPSSKAHQKSGPFPQPALPGFDGHTTPSDSRHGRRLRDVEAASLALDGSPPITRTTFPTCRAHYPGGSSGCACRLLPRSYSLPLLTGGSASALTLSRPAQASLTLRPAGLLNRLKRPLSRGSSPAGYEPLVS